MILNCQNEIKLSFSVVVFQTDVGRSCILVSVAGRNIMLDCGMHMGFNDDVCTFFFSLNLI